MPDPLLPLVEEWDPAVDLWDAARTLDAIRDSETNVPLFPHAIFFDSAGGVPHLRQYSYLSADPFFGPIRVERSDSIPASKRTRANPFRVLAEKLNLWKAATVPGLPPFQGGAAGVFSYGLNEWLEEIARPQFDEFAIPDMAVGFYDWVLAYDHAARRCWLISTGFPEIETGKRVQRAKDRMMEIRKALLETKSRSTASPPVFPPSADSIPFESHKALSGSRTVFSNFTRTEYEAAVGRVIEYICAGDCFQVNLSQRLVTPLSESPGDLYGRLRRCNAAPFGGYFDAGDFQILSASPERFLSLDATGTIVTRPIKGTRRRGSGTPEEDFALQHDLVTSEKDRAENVMIVDLMRNDLGRVCVYGSIHVSKLCELETYATVHHLVSEVRGQLRPGLHAIDLLRATFPGGSVTGAPKVRAMQIIAELERAARGPYCGSLGWIGFDGAMDTSILIRTMTVCRGWIQFPVGGGIVADSDPGREYEETLHKAEGMIRALQRPIEP